MSLPILQNLPRVLPTRTSRYRDSKRQLFEDCIAPCRPRVFHLLQKVGLDSEQYSLSWPGIGLESRACQKKLQSLHLLLFAFMLRYEMNQMATLVLNKKLERLWNPYLFGNYFRWQHMLMDENVNQTTVHWCSWMKMSFGSRCDRRIASEQRWKSHGKPMENTQKHLRSKPWDCSFSAVSPPTFATK